MNNIAIIVSNSNKNASIYESIDAIKSSGFKNVFIQWYNNEIWEVNQKDQLEYIKNSNLNIIFAHLEYKNINNIWLDSVEGDLLIEKYKRDIKICKDNGIDLVIMHPTNKFVAPMYNEIGLNRFKKIADYAKSIGVKIAFENVKIKGYLEYIISNINNDNVGVCFDSGHYHAFFNDELDFDLLKNRIFAVHLHDNDKSFDQHKIPFDGTNDWTKILENLKKCNYKGPITLEVSNKNYNDDIDINDFYKKAYSKALLLSNMYDNIK